MGMREAEELALVMYKGRYRADDLYIRRILDDLIRENKKLIKDQSYYEIKMKEEHKDMVDYIAASIGYPDWEVWDSIAYPTAKDAVMESVSASKA